MHPKSHETIIRALFNVLLPIAGNPLKLDTIPETLCNRIETDFFS